MRRIDSLLIKIQQAREADALQVSVAFVEQIGDKWRATVDLWDGVSRGKTERLTLDFDTMEDALEAVEQVKATHAPTGKRGKEIESVTIIDAISDV